MSFVIAFLSCSKDEVVDNGNGNGNGDGNAVTLNNKVNDFTWKAMNSWYNWQESVPNLANSKDDDTNSYYEYLNGFATPQELFSSLKHADDDFSWFIEDYVAQQQSFQGISKSFGMFIKFDQFLRPTSNSDNLFVYVHKVTKNSPADIAGVKRGDLIIGFGNEIFTTDNLSRVAGEGFNAETAEFIFGEKDGVTIKEKKTIAKDVIADDPIHLVKVFNNIAGKKVGYLAYNGFRSSFNDELNTAFGQLKGAGVQELVLDLRINGGGSVLTSAYLASMIYDGAGTNTTFAELRYNSKHTDRNARAPFFNNLNVYNSAGDNTGTQPINRLSGISRIYVLASDRTASASEMIINGLRPFIEVKIVGTKTTGKNEGSITLYDSPSSDFTNVDSANKEHKNAMQPIVFQIYNNLGQSDYNEGFEPNILINENSSWNNILPFGDENEVVLKAALNDIKGVSTRSSIFSNNNHIEIINSNLKENKFSTEMYIDHNFLKLAN